MRIQKIPFTELVTLEPHGPDTFVGISAEYPWGGRLFGGQVLAQGLRAAASTVDASRPVHSLHAYFIRPGSPDEPVRYEVERLRDGRSFGTRQVVARQSAGAILNLSVSFQTPEDEADVQLATMPPDAPEPDDPSLENTGWGGLLDRRAVPMRHGWAAQWMRLLSPLPDDPIVQACALVFMSDASPSSAARSSHPDSGLDWSDRHQFVGASLDHAIWFHRPTDATQWHWFEMDSHGLTGGRGLVTGNVLDRAGRHVATVAQEVLLRRRRSEP
jgi:acyl-CoA thioesterase-2